jgi:Thioredoxin domain
MKIEILGTGCYNCIKLEALINEVLTELGRVDVEVVRTADEKQILRFMPLDEIPGLVIDGTLINTRQIPERAILTEWFKAKEGAQ